MRVVHLAASAFVGGPESQMLGLIGHWPAGQSAVLSFAEGGRCRALLDAAAARGAETFELHANAPHYRAAVREVAAYLRHLRADVLLCHGYKPDILGLLAARAAGVPAVAVAHGWTAATWKVRLNETLDRLCMRRMDRVVCVSEAQAEKVRRAGVAARKVVVIRNAIDPALVRGPDPEERRRLSRLFAGNRPRWIVGTVGRLSPEKGFGVLIEAAARVVAERPDVAFVHYGDGPLRASLTARIEALGLGERFVLAGFRSDVAAAFPQFDLFGLPSYTEGLPCVVLEALAAGVAVVATAVGGTPEVVVDEANPDARVIGSDQVDLAARPNGRLVPPGNPEALARALLDLLSDSTLRGRLGDNGRALVLDRFTFQSQARHYQTLFDDLTTTAPRAAVASSV